MMSNRLISYQSLLFLGCVYLGGCALQPVRTDSSPMRGIYLSDVKNASVDIVYERGRNSHRFFVVNSPDSPQVYVFHDHQLFKSLKIKEDRFKELLSKSADAADTLQRKPARKLETPCRTPFVMTLKNTQETHSVEGCRGSDEGAVIGKLIAEIEYMISSDAK